MLTSVCPYMGCPPLSIISTFTHTHTHTHTHSRFLYEVQSHSDENKMNCRNLGMVFGHNILKPKVAFVFVHNRSVMATCVCVCACVCMCVCVHVCV